jgi:hypothetical protein
MKRKKRKKKKRSSQPILHDATKRTKWHHACIYTEEKKKGLKVRRIKREPLQVPIHHIHPGGSLNEWWGPDNATLSIYIQPVCHWTSTTGPKEIGNFMNEYRWIDYRTCEKMAIVYTYMRWDRSNLTASRNRRSTDDERLNNYAKVWARSFVCGRSSL